MIYLCKDPREKYRQATQRLQNAVAAELRQGVEREGAASVWVGKQTKAWKYIVSVVNPENPEFGDVMRIDPDDNEVQFFVQERWGWVGADPGLRCFGMWKDDGGVTHLDVNLSLPRSLENFSLAYRAARHFCQLGVWNGRGVQPVDEFGKSANVILQKEGLTAAELERIYFPLKVPAEAPKCL